MSLSTWAFLGITSHRESPHLTPPPLPPRPGVPYLGVTRVSSSEGCRMRQVVKVKVELVCDMHFPGWCARLEEGEGTKHISRIQVHPGEKESSSSALNRCKKR